MGKDKILKTVYEYYPRGIPSYDPSFDKQKEILKLKKILKNPPKTVESKTLLDKLKVKYGRSFVEDMSLLNWGNPCFHFRIQIEKNSDLWDEYIIFISLIDDYYYLYLHGDIWKNQKLNNDTFYQEIEKLIKDSFPKHKSLKSSIAKSSIPDVSYNNSDFGELNILNCLFTDHIY